MEGYVDEFSLIISLNNSSRRVPTRERRARTVNPWHVCRLNFPFRLKGGTFHRRSRLFVPPCVINRLFSGKLWFGIEVKLLNIWKCMKEFCRHLSGALGSVFYVASEFFVLIECDNKVEWFLHCRNYDFDFHVSKRFIKSTMKQWTRFSLDRNFHACDSEPLNMLNCFGE